MTPSKTPEIQTDQVKAYFDQIGTGYNSRYSAAEHPFLHFFYTQRLEAATAGFTPEMQPVLDVGAGKGHLYHFLSAHYSPLDYWACDISETMLADSGIPPERRFVGKVQAIQWPRLPFQSIFLLGVTNYLHPREWEETFQFLQSRTGFGGRIILSFTHRHSMDFQMQALLRWPAKCLGFSGKGLTQSFRSYAYTRQEVLDSIPASWEIKRWVWLNQSVFPFNRIWMRPSIKLAKWLFEKGVHWPFFSSDFLIEIQKTDS